MVYLYISTFSPSRIILKLCQKFISYSRIMPFILNYVKISAQANHLSGWLHQITCTPLGT